MACSRLTYEAVLSAEAKGQTEPVQLTDLRPLTFEDLQVCHALDLSDTLLHASAFDNHLSCIQLCDLSTTCWVVLHSKACVICKFLSHIFLVTFDLLGVQPADVHGLFLVACTVVHPIILQTCMCNTLMPIKYAKWWLHECRFSLPLLAVLLYQQPCHIGKL